MAVLGDLFNLDLRAILWRLDCEAKMSFDISLLDPVTKKVLVLDTTHHMGGGTKAYGGPRNFWLNITYNYSLIFQKVMGPKGIRAIYGMTGAESIPLLVSAAAALSEDYHEDYWNPTEGNAKTALLNLACMAALRPDGVWDGD